jgi:hypothetical protein
VTRIRHRIYLRRYIKLHPGAPDSFDCDGGWHEAKAAIGYCDGSVPRGSAAEKKLTPPRLDERWPMKCDGCDYEFTNRDRYQLIVIPTSETQ